MAASQLHIILGNDEGRVREEAQKVLAEVAPRLDPEFGFDTIDGLAANAEQGVEILGKTLQALQTLPFFGEKLVHLKDTNLFGSNQTAGAEEVVALGESLLDEVERGLPPNVHFLITGDKRDGVRRNAKRLAKLGKVIDCNKIDTSKAGWEEQVRAYIHSRATKVGANFSEEALDLFALLIGAETKLIDAELEKLTLYVGSEREIHVDDVQLMTPLSESGYIFEIGEALARRDGAKAVDLIDRQLEVGGKKGAGESAIALIRAAIIPTIRKLLQAKILQEKHGVRASHAGGFSNAVNKLPASATGFLDKTKKGTVNAYGVGMVANQAKAFSLPGLVSALTECLEADRALVTTGLDHRLVLHRLVGRILVAAA